MNGWRDFRFMVNGSWFMVIGWRGWFVGAGIITMNYWAFAGEWNYHEWLARGIYGSWFTVISLRSMTFLHYGLKNEFLDAPL